MKGLLVYGPACNRIASPVSACGRHADLVIPATVSGVLMRVVYQAEIVSTRSWDSAELSRVGLTPISRNVRRIVLGRVVMGITATEETSAFLVKMNCRGVRHAFRIRAAEHVSDVIGVAICFHRNVLRQAEKQNLDDV